MLFPKYVQNRLEFEYSHFYAHFGGQESLLPDLRV